MQKLFDKLRAREAVTRRVCRVISVAAFVLGVASVVFEWWIAGAAAITALISWVSA